MTQCNKYLQGKLFGQEDIPCDTPQLTWRKGYLGMGDGFGSFCFLWGHLQWQRIDMEGWGDEWDCMMQNSQRIKKIFLKGIQYNKKIASTWRNPFVKDSLDPESFTVPLWKKESPHHDLQVSLSCIKCTKIILMLETNWLLVSSSSLV